jgi:hypothetical protein
LDKDLAGDLDFLADFGIEISIRLMAARAAPPKPRVGDGASGAGSQGVFRPQVNDSTAPIAVKCQSYLDYFIAQLGLRERRTRISSQASSAEAATVPLTFADDETGAAAIEKSAEID